jgi:aryl-alcohol dehydrogenase-like predicted oxidoreductase
MNYVDFDSVGLRLSKIAFGCAPVMGRIGRAQALRAMGAAFDAGVTHFDVARSYGYGEAESVLGQFAAGKRDHITIATKFGIAPPRQQRVLRLIKPVVRQLAHHAKGLRSLVRNASSHTLTKGNFDLPSARHSFDQSLRALRVDYVDILFLHDCSPDGIYSDELLMWLEGLVQAGKARTWGIATRAEWMDEVYSKLGNKPAIVQCQGGIAGRPLPATAQLLPAILHSPFGGTAGAASAHSLAQAASAVLRPVVGTNDTPTSKKLPSLLLESALYLSRNQVVLCSMFHPEHIRANVAAIEHPLFTHEQLDTFIKTLDTAAQNRHATPLAAEGVL